MLAPKFAVLTVAERDSLRALVRNSGGDLSVRRVHLLEGRYAIRWDRVRMHSYQTTIDNAPCDVPECYLGTEQQMQEAQQSVATDMTKALSVPEIAANAVATGAAAELQEAGQLSRAGPAAAMSLARHTAAAAVGAAGDDLLSESGGRTEVNVLQATHQQLQQFSMGCRQQAEDMCKALGAQPSGQISYICPPHMIVDRVLRKVLDDKTDCVLVLPAWFKAWHGMLSWLPVRQQLFMSGMEVQWGERAPADKCGALNAGLRAYLVLWGSQSCVGGLK